MIHRNDDPPDEPEVPECCGEVMEFLQGSEAGYVLVCRTCGRREEMPADGPEPVLDDYQPSHPPCVNCGNENPNGCQLCDACSDLECNHGNRYGNCDRCDFEADFAYTAAREGKL